MIAILMAAHKEIDLSSVKRPTLGRQFTRKISDASTRAAKAAIADAAQMIVEEGYKYFTTRELHFKFLDATIVVPEGFLTDGASGPGWDELDEAHWILHDFLYATHNTDVDRQGRAVSKQEADSVLLLPWRKLAVSLFGIDAWEKSGARGPQFLTLH